MPTISQALASQALATSPSAVPAMVNYPSLWNAANAAANDKESLVPRRRAASLHAQPPPAQDVEAQRAVTVSDVAAAAETAEVGGGGGGGGQEILFPDGRRRSSDSEMTVSRRRSLAVIERNRGRRASVTRQAFLLSEAKQEIREMHR